MKKTFLTLTCTLMLSFVVFAQIGSIDPDFNPGTGFGPDQWSGKCEAITQDPDGNLLVGGSFKTFNNNTALYVVRLNSDGKADNTFTSPFDDSWGAEVRQIHVLNNGKILACGTALQANSASLPGIVRLNSDGTLDAGFNAPSSVTTCSTFDVQADGKIVLGNLVRLNADGSPDNTFNTGSGISGGSGFGSVRINKVRIQPDGKILIGGHFSKFNGDTALLLARLNNDGTIDNSFNANSNFAPAVDGFYGQIYSLKLLPNGQILIGGNYGNSNSTAFGIDRLNSDGSLDTTFKITHSFSNIRNYTLDVQSDGKVLAANVNFGTPAEAFVVERYHLNGELDSSFAKKYVNSDVKDLRIQSDGNIVFVGYFSYNPTGIMRLLGDAPLLSVERSSEVSSGILMYPNPAGDIVHLSNLNGSSSLTISDISGKTIFRTGIRSDQMSIPTLSFTKGTYFIQIHKQGSTYTQKLLINR
ncbi:MAG: T9SS type A sorting domain-containing protein [Flavobacteriales bacterium]|nr:T9SS type A sorting domain-containing protein [Flavobacteriales bacterium]